MEYDRLLGVPRRVLATAFLAVAPITGLAGPSVEASQQGAGGAVTVDAPAAGAMATDGRPFNIGGWAVQPSGPGTGVQRVDVYLDGPAGTGTYLGTAHYGIPRRDVASAFNRPEWTNSGFALVWIPTGVAPGSHVLHVVAQGADGLAVSSSVPVSVSASYAACTFALPCYLYRDSYGWTLDYGGPGLRMDYFPDFRP